MWEPSTPSVSWWQTNGVSSLGAGGTWPKAERPRQPKTKTRMTLSDATFPKELTLTNNLSTRICSVWAWPVVAALQARLSPKSFPISRSLSCRSLVVWLLITASWKKHENECQIHATQAVNPCFLKSLMLNEKMKYMFLFMFCSNELMLFTILKYNSYELFHFTI